MIIDYQFLHFVDIAFLHHSITIGIDRYLFVTKFSLKSDSQLRVLGDFCSSSISSVWCTGRGTLARRGMQ